MLRQPLRQVEMRKAISIKAVVRDDNLELASENGAELSPSRLTASFIISCMVPIPVAASMLDRGNFVRAFRGAGV